MIPGSKLVVLLPYLAIAVMFGLWKWQKHETAAAELHRAAVERSLSMAETELKNTVAVANQNAEQMRAWQADALRQREIISKTEAKSAERLRALNRLSKDIADVKENPPVSDAIERILDAERLRSSVPGDGQAASGSNQTGDGGAPGSDQNEVPTSTSATP